MKKLLPFLIVGFVAVATLTGGAILYRANRPAVLAVTQQSPRTPEDDKTMHVRGPAKSRVTLEEFGDYQCPPCGALAGPLRQIEQQNASSIRIIFRNFPLAIHQHAFQAACAAEAAGLQGKFWEMHDLLFREQGVWSKAANVKILFDSYAGILGLNVTRFNRDMQSAEVTSRIENDRKLGASLGIKTTPTILINNRVVPPTSLNPDGLRRALREEMNASG